MNLKLTDKTALVSGSTKGIGFAVATSLAREGARVIVNGRSEEAVAEAKKQIADAVPDAKVEGFAGDLSTAAATDALLRQFPSVDILVNNLGIFEPKPFEQIPDEDWRRFFEVNVLSGVRLSRAYLPGMKQRNWGRIVFISSESAIQIPVEMIHYGMTKTAQLAVSRGLAESCAGTGVTVNAVLPGPTRSAGVDEFVAKLSGGKPFAGIRKGVLRHRPPDLASQAVCDDRRGRQSGDLCLQPAGCRDQWRSPPRGRWRGPSVLLMRLPPVSGTFWARSAASTPETATPGPRISEPLTSLQGAASFFFALDCGCPTPPRMIGRMRMKFFPPYKDEGEIVAYFGQARLIKFLDGKLELHGGSDGDRAEAREWMSLFWHEAVVRCFPGNAT